MSTVTINEPDSSHVALEVRLHREAGQAGADGGFGLQLVDRMADRWWIERGAGTRVVCEFQAAVNRRRSRR